MIKKLIKIRNNFLENITKDIESYIDTLLYLSMPKEFDIETFYPEIFERPDYYTHIRFYKTSHLEELVNFAKKKSDEVSIGEDCDKKKIVFIHPFYPFLRHLNLCSKESKEYQENLIRYFNSINQLVTIKNYNRILIDAPDSFLLTYSLWKKNPLNKVLFTQHNTGKLLDNTILRLEESFICGAYLGRCIDDVIDQSEDKDYKLIKELILYRPMEEQKPNIYNYPLVFIEDIKEDEK